MEFSAYMQVSANAANWFSLLRKSKFVMVTIPPGKDSL